MKRLMMMVLATVTVAVAIGCNRGRDAQSEALAIQDTEKQWNQDYTTKDVDKLVSYYSEDAVMMAPGMAPSVGRESIRATLKQMLADPALTLKFTAAKIDVAESGDLGYARGAYVITMTDPQSKKPIHDQGSYVTTYRKDADGKWKAVADIASSEIPPGQQQLM